MKNIFCITTHINSKNEAAEEWKRTGVCAIGFHRKGNLKKLKQDNIHPQAKLFLEIKKGDVVLAYAGNSMIAYVGEVVNGKHIYNDKNKIGGEKNFGSPNQLKVKWRSEPHNFNRKEIEI